MKTIRAYFASLAVCGFLLTSCSDEGNHELTEQAKRDSLEAAAKKEYATKEGIIGVVEMPEMLTLSKLDSASARDMAFKLGQDYSVLETEAKAIGAQIDGSPGVINYNNDTANFKFECILLIKEVPKKELTQCKVVVLEATQMLLYNHYGPYENLIDSYETIRVYMAEHKLKQNGPMREFYLSDPTLEKDPTKWLTRVMVPVEETK